MFQSGRKMEQSDLYDTLSYYGESDFYPYHMPGHKRTKKLPDWERIFRIDITEIDGFDNLHEAEGILKQAQMRAADLYGATESFYLINGSTCGVLASILAVTEQQDEILIARNCHKSVYHAAILQDLTLRYLYPGQIEEYGIADGICPEAVEEALREYPSCKAVVITSPTYEGVISDVRRIAETVHSHDKILIVDEAHGAHLGLMDGMSENAVSAGADLVIHSLHKTLPAMTQTALLHRNGERVNGYRLRRYLNILQSSSPSYVMMAGIDSCISYLEKEAAAAFSKFRKQYSAFIKRTDQCRHIRIGRVDKLRPGYDLSGWDICKLVISVKGSIRTGKQIYDCLREEFHLQAEMAADSYILAIMTIMDEEEGWQRLADALCQIDDRIEEDNKKNLRNNILKKSYQKITSLTSKPVAALSISQAFDRACQIGMQIPVEQAKGKIAGDFVNLYPPGIPILVPGEKIGDSEIAQIRNYIAHGLHVQGISQEGHIPVC